MTTTTLRPGEARFTKINGEFVPEFADPRPDLKEDSALWVKFLTAAWNPDNSDLYFTLHGFRCNSLRLVRGSQGYVLRPEFDERSGFSDEQDYREARDKYLVPHSGEIGRLLRGLEG